MPTLRTRHAFVTVLLVAAVLLQGTWALAGTTGNITGTLTDSTTGKPVANAQVGATSPSQSAQSTTDAGGHFTFLGLAPDTYTVSVSKDGYAPISIGGVTVFADQSSTLTLATHPELKTIARVTSRAAGNLVKPGTTADVYSVNAATQQVVGSSSGGYNLNQAYSAIYSQPGVNSYIGNAGWGQVFYIRGSAYSQVGYEFDGVPVNRAFDNYQANSLSNLGQQELQVYTGGSPSGASSATLGGFINQVIKTGTYPGFGTLIGGIGAPGFYHAVTAEAGGANPDRTFSYYVGIMGYNQHFPAGSWTNLSNISSSGLNQYGLASGGELATTFGALPGAINGAPPDAGAWAGQFENGPFSPCQSNGANAGLPIGATTANPGPFNGACFGYYPFNTFLSDIFERDNVLNLHFAIPHKFDSGRDDIQLLYDNSMQLQLNGDALTSTGGLAGVNALLAPFGTSTACTNPVTGSSAACGSFTATGTPYTGNAPGLCGYENLFGLGCASTNTPIPYVDTLIFGPGTAFGQQAANAQIIPYFFPNSSTNRPLNTPFAPVSGVPANMSDGFHNDVGIVKAQYTKNFGSKAYARLFGYTFYSDWLIGGAPSAATCYIDGFLCTNGGPGWFGTADYELSTHTRGAEFQFADQFNAQNLLRFTANYTTASVARWNNGSFLAGFLGSRSRVTDWTTGDPNNPTCFAWKSNPAQGTTAGFPGNCDVSSVGGTFSDPMPADLNTECAAGGSLASTPGCASFLSGKSNWLVTVPSGQGTFNTVKPIFTSLALEDEFKPTDKIDLNIGVRFEQYRYDLANSNTPEFNFWFNAYAQTLCYDPGTGLPSFTPLGLGQPVPPNLITTPVVNQTSNGCYQPPDTTAFPTTGCPPGVAPNPGTAWCPVIAPSGQIAVHPTGLNGSTKYSAAAPTRFTHNEFSPRIGGTFSVSPDTVLRFSAGRYTQPTETAFEQYLDQSGKRAANFDFSRFWGLGFHTPAHDNPVQYSNNYDFSIEHRLHATDWTLKVSPFYRDTHNQIETVVLGPGFVSGTNTGHQHSYGVELAIAKGDPTRDGWSGQISYTYTKALVQFGDLPNGTNSIDYLNNYVKAFNALTQAGGGSPCYNAGVGEACPATLGAADIVNPYFSMSQQPLLDRSGWYQPWPNEFPNAPNDQGGASAIWPHQFSAWVQYKHGRLAVAPNIVIQSGAYYGSPTDVYGTDPRACGQNEAAATTPGGGAVPGLTSSTAGFCDFLTAGPTPFTDSGFLAIPNPYTGKFDTPGRYQEPWQLNLGALIHYDISPKISASLALSNIYNACYGGTKTAWQSAFKPGRYVCGYSSQPGGVGSTGGNFNYVGPLAGQPGFGGGFFYGNAPASASNGSPVYPNSFNFPFAPFTGALPFQAYLQINVKF